MTDSQEPKKTRRPGQGRKPTDAPLLAPISLEDGGSIERQVYSALRMALLTGRIFPGRLLTSRSMSAALGVSPTPVREALKRLEADRALVSRNKSAFVVNDPDQTDFAELLEIRLNLEGLAIRNAALNARKSDVEVLRALNDDYEQLLAQERPGTSKSLSPNFEFHFQIYKLSGSSMLVDLIETLWLRIGPMLFRHVANGADLSLVSRQPHRDMLTALSRNDPDAADHALRMDLDLAAKSIMPLLPVRKSDGSGNHFGRPKL